MNQTLLLPQNVMQHQHLSSFLQDSVVRLKNRNSATNSTQARSQRHDIAKQGEEKEKTNKQRSTWRREKKETNKTSSILPRRAKRALDLEIQTDYRNCSFNQPYPRPRHACFTTPETKIPYCHIENLLINYTDVSMISLNARGGEKISQVMGQNETDEFPSYKPGAFVTSRPLNVRQDIDRSQMFYIENVLDSVRVVDQQKLECDVRLGGNTLLLTRYEYCNLYHTMTDWFNAFLAMPSKTNIIFLDAHAEGKLDPVWTTLWGNVTYIRQWEGKKICLQEATLIPAGYASVLWPRTRIDLSRSVCPSMVEAFVEFFVKGHLLGDIQMEQGKVVIVDRVPYLAHPRSKPSSAQRIVKNFDELADQLKKKIEVSSIQIVHFENMTFREQLAVIRSAHVLIGNHGAGLAHLIFMQDNSTLMEFEQPGSGMMADFSRWKTTIQHFFLPRIQNGQISIETIHKRIVPLVQAVLLGETIR